MRKLKTTQLPKRMTPEMRKEKNKNSAAKSRANRKAMFDDMERTIQLLRMENAALMVELNNLRERAMDTFVQEIPPTGILITEPPFDCQFLFASEITFNE